MKFRVVELKTPRFSTAIGSNLYAEDRIKYYYYCYYYYIAAASCCATTRCTPVTPCRRRRSSSTTCRSSWSIDIHTYKHPFNGPLSGTIRVSRYRKGKTSQDFTEASDSEWQWHQLGHMQVCTSLQTDNHASTPPLSFCRPDALPAAQPTASKHHRLILVDILSVVRNGRTGVHPGRCRPSSQCRQLHCSRRSASC